LTDKQDIHFNKLANKTYVSHRIGQSHTERPIRIASKVLEVSGGHAFAREKDELVLRTTPSGRHEIKATFFEDDRGILTLTIQKFNKKSGPSDGWYFSFIHHEIDQLITFLLNIKRINFPDSGKLNVSDEQLSGMLIDSSQAIRLLADNVDIFENLQKVES
jgi:hypothetical protein